MRALLALACLCWSLAVAAAERPPGADGEKTWRREINGHLFIPSLNIIDPFVPTAASLQSGVGGASVTTEPPTVAGAAIGTGSYRAATIGQTVGMQVGVFRWWGLRAIGYADAYWGLGRGDAAVVGATVLWDALFGTTASWQLGRYVRLGGTFDVDYRPAREILPAAPIARTLEAGRLDLSGVRERTTALAVVPGATIAVAPHPAFGAVATVQYAWEHRDEEGQVDAVSRLVVGVVLDFDVRPLARQVPLGILASYRMQAALNADERTRQDLEGGLFYTGNDELAVGLVARARWLEVRSGVDATAVGGSAVLRYFWN
jgi:hypothetical protein